MIVADNGNVRYNPMPFPVTVTVTNTGGMRTDSVFATIYMTPDLTLATGEQSTKRVLRITSYNVCYTKLLRRRLRTDVKVKMWVEPPAELKELAPDQAHDFWYTQNAHVVNVIEPYQKP